MDDQQCSSNNDIKLEPAETSTIAFDDVEEVDDMAGEIVEVMLLHQMELHLPKELVKRIQAEDKENTEEFYPLSVNGKVGGVRIKHSKDSVIMKIEGQSSKENECLCILSELEPKEEVVEVIEEVTLDELAILPLEQMESMSFENEDQVEKIGVNEEISQEDTSPCFYSCVLCKEAEDLEEEAMKKHVTECHNMDFPGYQLMAREYCHLCREKFTVSVQKHVKEKHCISSVQYFKLSGMSSGEKEAFITNISYAKCKKIKTEPGLQNHEEHSHDKRVFKFKCDLCAVNKRMRTEEMLIIHKLMQHPTIEKSGKYVCTHCEGRYDKKKDYYKHVPVCTVHPVYVCFTCEKVFSNEEEYTTHITDHPNKKRFMCDVCGASFAFKCTFYAHRKHKHQEKPVSPKFQCNTCGKSFITMGLLNKHTARTHANPRNHICEQCGSAFKSRQHLRAHVLKIHDNIYPFYCEICGLGFSSSAGVKKHRCTGIRFKSRAEKALFLAKEGPLALEGVDVKVENVLDVNSQGNILAEENVLIEADDPTLFLETLDSTVCINPVQ